ncbi:alanyl-tRNA synthetase [Parvularcula bermudensis HTCC2503]|uniref:Alanyl-tRNA synthetase n=1 Tax=Parvularcula bermudensis (strain ATCC BAA-594 / HTCC2503 / KCTC 12087) TaxID=314260 RepID=E0TEF7_PARBH|nr:hypothetical protein [Parvularcula bermudensis]ADM10043.1 alanyl-tRNA synthetase [Parvularcula bermudensis HTCC2503]
MPKAKMSKKSRADRAEEAREGQAPYQDEKAFGGAPRGYDAASERFPDRPSPPAPDEEVTEEGEEDQSADKGS